MRSLLTVIGIGLGVGILFAAQATNASIDRSVDRTVKQLVGRADLRVSAFQETGLSDTTLAAIRGTPGVAIAEINAVVAWKSAVDARSDTPRSAGVDRT